MLPLTHAAISFASPPKPVVKSFRYYGDTAPLEHFDPLRINSGTRADESRIRRWREAELNHGRTAMLGGIALPALKMLDPDASSIDYLSNLPLLSQSPFWAGMACYEFVRLNVGFKPPNNGNSFSLLKTYQPGNVLAKDPASIREDTYNQELNNGRLAMLACTYMISTGY